MKRSTRRAPDPVYRTILVPLDGSRFAEGAIPTARALAGRLGATVHTISVAESDVELHRFRDDAARALGADPEDPRIHVVDTDTDVADAVSRCAAMLDACLVCMSSHGRGRVAGTVFGSTARDIIERHGEAAVVVGPRVVDAGASIVTAPLEADNLVACVDGTLASERGLPVAAAWAHVLGMELTILTVAEPCPPPIRIGAPWRRHHGPNDDADEYVRLLGEQWQLEAPKSGTVVVYDPISPGSGMRDYLRTRPTGLVVVTSALRNRFTHLVFGSGAADIVHESAAPVLVVPSPPTEAGERTVTPVGSERG